MNDRSALFFGLLFIPAILFATVNAIAQTPASAQTATLSDNDLGLVRGEAFTTPDEFAHYHGAGNSDKTLKNKQHNAIAEYNPISLVLKGALLGYQKLVSQQLGRECPYAISCSNFSKLSIQEFGAFKGIFIGADRLLRCNRIGILDVSPTKIDPNTGRIIDSPNMYRW